MQQCELDRCDKLLSGTSCNLPDVLCALTGNPLQKDVISKVLVSFLGLVSQVNQSEASTSMDNGMPPASHVIMKYTTVL
jgi:hypothetical protein